MLFIRIASALMVVLLVACSPRYDWRELQPAKDPLAMMLPGKPAVLTRQINLNGRAVTMHMHGVQVDGHSFTAAWLQLDEAGLSDTDKAAGRTSALQAMQQGMLNNIAGKVTEQSGRTIGLIDPSGRAVGRVPAVQVIIEGTAAGKPVQMHGVFVGFGARLYQFVVIGADTPPEQIKTYLDSVRVRTDSASAIAAGS